MKTIAPVIFIMIFLFVISPFKNKAQEYDKDDKIRIGFILDGERKDFDDFIETIKQEIGVLLDSKYKKLKFPEEKLYMSDWTARGITENINAILSDEEVDIVIGIGTITSALLVDLAPFEKPVITIGIIHPTFQRVPITEDNTSGINNFTYVTLPFSPARDIEVFQSIYPYNNLGILISEEFLKTVPSSEAVEDYFIEIAEQLNIDYNVFSIGSDFEQDIANLPDSIDAVYVGLFFNLADSDIEKLINAINSKKLASFALGGGRFVEMGVLAAVSAEEITNRQSRRIALNIEKILEGKNPSNLPVLLSYNENLVFNMRTIHEIGFYPSWSFLSEAEVLYDTEIVSAQLMDIHMVVSEALYANMDLKVAQQEVLSNEKEIKIARSDLLPQLDIFASGTVMDADVAESSMGSMAQREIVGAATLNQLIYSDKALGNVYIQKRLQQSQEYVYDQVELDIILDATTTYLALLQAKTLESIFQENVNLSRKNLEIARLRNEIGYLGAADVYRWESEIALSKMELINAGANREQAEFVLKRVINKSLISQIFIQDVSIFDTILNIDPMIVEKYVDNPQIYGVFRNFFINEAVNNLPEIKQIDALIEAQERYLTTNKRSYYLPTLTFQAQSSYNFYRGGAGSTVEPVEIPGVGLIELGTQPNDYYWDAGISLIYPLSQGGLKNALTQQARIDLSILEEDRLNISQKLVQQVLSAFSSVSASHPNIQLSREAADAAQKNYDLVQDAYSQGTVSIVQLLDAQNAALGSKFTAANAVYQYMIDALHVQRAIGQFFITFTEEERAEFYNRLENYMSEGSISPQ